MNRPTTTYQEKPEIDDGTVEIESDALKLGALWTAISHIGSALLYINMDTKIFVAEIPWRLRKAALMISGRRKKHIDVELKDEDEFEYVPMNARQRYAILGVEMIGMCLRDLAICIQQGIREDNYAKRAGVAFGLKKAALNIEGKRHIAKKDDAIGDM